MSLSAQKVSLSVPILISARNVSGVLRPVDSSMDLGIIAAIVMLIVWAVATIATEASGYVHALLTAGVFCSFGGSSCIGATRSKDSSRKP